MNQQPLVLSTVMWLNALLLLTSSLRGENRVEDLPSPPRYVLPIVPAEEIPQNKPSQEAPPDTPGEKVEIKMERRHARKGDLILHKQLSFLISTPFSLSPTSSDPFDKRYYSYGGNLWLSLPIWSDRGERFVASVESGLSTMTSRLDMASYNGTVLHTYFILPLHVRSQWDTGVSNLYLEGIVGISAKVFEYDSRQAPVGGWFFVNRDIVMVEFGGGAQYQLMKNWALRLLITNWAISLGACYAF